MGRGGQKSSRKTRDDPAQGERNALLQGEELRENSGGVLQDPELSSFRDLLSDLFTAEHTPPPTRLIYLSNLGREEMALLAEKWPSASRNRQHEIMGQLVRITRGSFDYNFDSIFRIGLESPDPFVRRESIAGLGECEDYALIEPMARLLKTDPAGEVRASAAVCLGSLGTLAELGKLTSGHGAAVYRALLHACENASEAPAVRMRALEAAAVFNTGRVAELIEEASLSPEPAMRLAGVVAMGHTCDPRWLPDLEDEFAADEAPTRAAAALAAGEIGTEEAVPGLIRLTRDPSLEVKLAAIEALGEIGGEVGKKVLESLLKDPGKRVRETAREALSELQFWEDSGAPTRPAE